MNPQQTAIAGGNTNALPAAGGGGSQSQSPDQGNRESASLSQPTAQDVAVAQGQMNQETAALQPGFGQ